jgi:ABC-2 type transport system ATP-binding protein
MEAPIKTSLATSPLAELRGVSKQLGTTRALDDLTLQIGAGELVALLGPNGSGKTTAISIMLGLRRPDSGSSRLLGGDPLDITTRRRIGVMLQEAALPAELTVRELIELMASYYPDPLPLDEILRLTHVEAFADKRYAVLSGGMKRQVQFALAICGRPRLIFLDEPTVGLDIESRSQLWGTIRTLLKGGTSVLLTTHYLEEAEALADRVVVMAHGHVIASGTVEEMRRYVNRKRVSCKTKIPLATLSGWAEVVHAGLASGADDRTELTVTNAESFIRRLLDADPDVTDLELARAGLAEAFVELTRNAR